MRILNIFVVLFILKALEAFSFNGIDFSNKPCASTPLISDFNISRYLGKWYEIERITPAYEIGLDCVTAEYENLGNGIIRVRNSGKNLALNIPLSINGTAKVVNPSKPNELQVNFFQNNKVNIFNGNYNVWLTDYDQYALVHSCSKRWIMKIETVWILSRKTTLPDNILNNLKEYIRSKDIAVEKLYKVKQTCN